VAHGFEDWTLSTTPTVITADKLDSGLDADKTAVPEAGQVYYARDTKVLYLCAAAGAWTGIDAASLVEGSLTLYANMAGGGYKLTNIGAPTAATDAARKSEVDTVNDKLDDVSVAKPTRALDTIYQNTGGKIRLVSVTALCQVVKIATAVDGYSFINAYCDANSSPSTFVSRFGLKITFDGLATQGDSNALGSVVLIVPPSYYYKVGTSIWGDGRAPVLNDWVEYDLH
jgi:hypothetical protein